MEAEILELKANPNKPAVGTVVEAALDKGRGYVSTILVESGTLHVGDYVLAGTNSDKNYGGKQTMLPYILPLIPPHKVYTEVFFEGGNILYDVLNRMPTQLLSWAESLKNHLIMRNLSESFLH